MNTHSGSLAKASSQFFSRTNGGTYDLTTGTIEMWIKMASNPAADYGLATTNTGATAHGFKFSVNNNRTLNFYILNQSKEVSGVTVMSTSTAYHVAVAWDTSEAKLYINGTLDATSSSWGTLTGAGDDLAIGKEILAAAGGRYFDGLIDDVRIWNTKRTATEINNNKSIVLAGNESGLLSYWKLDNNGTDSTSGGRDLTAQNGATYSTTNLFPGLIDGSDTFPIAEGSVSFSASVSISASDTFAITDGTAKIESAFSNEDKPSVTGWTNESK